jgi:hypothetical protein
MLTALRLPFHFDAERLKSDLARVAPDEWAPHYNAADYGGVWRGAALRSASGLTTDLRSVAGEFQDTALLDRCRSFREVVGAFQCRVKSVRLLGLASGSFIREHSDHALDFEDGEARIHVPVLTNSGVEFYLSGERLLLDAGGAYYVNVNLPHRVNNHSDSERVHLVIDAEVNEWVRELFAKSTEIRRGKPRPHGVEAFRDAAMTDPGLRDELSGIAGVKEFETAAVRLGREHGFDFNGGDVDAALHGVPSAGAPGGLAYELLVRGGRPFLAWTDTGEHRLEEPFFDETVRARLKRPWARFTRRCVPLDVVSGGPALKGLIFHMSRCGSTLLSQMLKAAGYRVASEPPPVDAALRSNPAWLPAVVTALGAEFVKLDAWHIHELETIRAQFPTTPWIFVHRDAAEVLASQRQSPGMHALPGAMDPKALRMAWADVTTLDREAWTERVIGKMREAAERHREDATGLFVDYRDLPEAAWGPVAGHFGIEFRAEQVERMREAAQFDAKSPGKVWESRSRTG